MRPAVPARSRWLIGETVSPAVKARRHGMRLPRAHCILVRIAERADHFQELYYRARPAMGKDDGKRVFVLRRHMQEMNSETLDLCAECGKALI